MDPRLPRFIPIEEYLPFRRIDRNNNTAVGAWYDDHHRQEEAAHLGRGGQTMLLRSVNRMIENYLENIRI